ncbi:gypsy retrotransposon integrase-like protein 1 isoform 2-T3 [Synchiropus picturatus]
MKIDSFPHFFHGDYCATQDILWAPDDSVGVRSSEPENVIEVTGPWQWLGLDLRGPLPKTPSAHRYLLTVTDFFSKWVEAAPLESCLPSLVAKNVSEVIAHFGFPLGILSRLPQELVSEINTALQDQLTISVPLLVHHQQAGRVDADTQQVFSLCFQEDPTTRRRPFSVLCCGGVEPVPSPREPQLNRMKIQDSAFVVT